MKRHYSMAALRMVALGAAVVLSLAGIARAADFITGYAWRTLTVNSDLAEPSTLAQSNCHLKSDGTTEPCTTANADLTFTTDGFDFHTTPGEQASSQTFRQFLDTNLSSFTVNNKSYQNGVGDSTFLDVVIFNFVGNGTFNGTPSSPQTFTFAHDDGLTFIVNGSTVVDRPQATSPVTTNGTYTGGAGHNLPFQLVYVECCTPPAVLQTTLVGPSANPNPLTTIQFDPTVYSVIETAGVATITVTRTGPTTGISTVHYATSDGTALAGTDYVATSGTLTFNLGDTSKTFDVPITNDHVADGAETVNLRLSNFTGASIGPSMATLTINDQTSGGTSPTIVSGPSANPNPTYTTTTSLSVQANSSSGGQLNYTWKLTGSNPSPNVAFSPNNSLGAANSTATFPGPGTYHIMVTVLDTLNQGTVDSNPIVVTVVRDPKTIVVAPPSQIYTIGQAQPLDVTATITDQWGVPMNLTPNWTSSAGSLALRGLSVAFTDADVNIRQVSVTASLVNAVNTALSDSAQVTIVVSGAGQGGDLSNAKVGPVPFKANSGDPGIKFRNLAPGTRIRIFTLTGRIVQTLDSPNGSDVLWDIKNANVDRVASGVYLYILEGAGQKREGKLVVIQ